MDSIVIMDSDENMIQLLTEEMDWSALNCRVEATAGKAEEGIAQIRLLRPRIVITEIALPGMSGLEMIRQLREEGYGGAFIILTERRIFEEARQAVQLGVSGFLLKPPDLHEAEMTVRRILERAAAEGEGAENWIKERGGGEQKGDGDETGAENETVRESYLIRQSLLYISAHLYQELSLTAVCEAMGVSPSYLSRLFKQEVGMGFLKYVRMKKLEQARRLLKNPSNKVFRVAEMMGYHNYSYFYQIYREQFGFSPGERR